jgi:adenosylcobinamide-phosphate synthase
VLSGLAPLTLALLLAAGVALDLLLGEARRWHPLSGFGALARWLERRLNRGGLRIARGAAAWTLAVLPLTAAAAWLCVGTGVAGLALHVLLLYLCIGLRSLRDHLLPIHIAHANEADLAKAGAESLLENGNDAVFGTLFWFLVGGGPAALLFRLANTLDAMWGYRTTRFNLFGRVAARFDDVLNYVPARLTALSYALLAPGAGRLRALRCWRAQAKAWSSPNAGPVMASGAGALGVSLGGAATYDGEVEQRPVLGAGPAAAAGDIPRAWRLVFHAALMWVGVALVLALALGTHFTGVFDA